MKKFRQFLFESIFEEVLKEGGNAVSNVQKIAQNNVQPTLDKFYQVLLGVYPNLKWDDTIFKLGSTGKKDFSGDLDIGIDFNAIQREKGETVLEQLEHLFTYQASLVTQMVKNLPVMQETQIRSLGWEGPLEKGMATHSSVPAWGFHGQRNLMGSSPWGHKRVGHD